MANKTKKIYTKLAGRTWAWDYAGFYLKTVNSQQMSTSEVIMPTTLCPANVMHDA